MHELVPEVPLRHGHAISIDMAYSATLANMRGLVSDKDHKRILGLFSRAGLSMDHFQFDEDILDKGTKAILKTRDGKLRAAVPAPLGECVFLNDVTQEELNAALRKHKEIMKNYPRNGEGIEAFVDASDTGYTMNKKAVEANGNGAVNGNANGDHAVNGHATNGHATNGHATNGHTNGHAKEESAIDGEVINEDKLDSQGNLINKSSLKALDGNSDRAMPLHNEPANAAAKLGSEPRGLDGVVEDGSILDHHTNGD